MLSGDPPYSQNSITTFIDRKETKDERDKKKRDTKIIKFF
jgi:hypothetical protein